VKRALKALSRRTVVTGGQNVDPHSWLTSTDEWRGVEHLRNPRGLWIRRRAQKNRISYWNGDNLRIL